MGHSSNGWDEQNQNCFDFFATGSTLSVIGLLGRLTNVFWFPSGPGVPMQTSAEVGGTWGTIWVFRGTGTRPGSTIGAQYLEILFNSKYSIHSIFGTDFPSKSLKSCLSVFSSYKINEAILFKKFFFNIQNNNSKASKKYFL